MKIKRWIIIVRNTKNTGYLVAAESGYYHSPTVTQDIDKARGFFSFDHAESVAHNMWLAHTDLEYDIKEVDRDPGDGIANQAIIEFFESMAEEANADYIHMSFRVHPTPHRKRFSVTLVDKDLFQLQRSGSTPHDAYNKIVIDYKAGLARS